MLQIGAFSLLSKIGVRTLRYYANFGLLVPAHIDVATNYRYYKEEQLVLANRIEALRAMGMSLRQIKQLLLQYDNSESLQTALLEEIQQREMEISKGQTQLKLLQSAAEYFAKENYCYHCNIIVKELTAQKVLSYRAKVPAYQQESFLWDKLYNFAGCHNIPFSAPPINIAIYHDKEYRDKDIDIEVQKGIQDISLDDETISFILRPKVLAATVIMKGEFSFYQELNTSVAHWISQNGYELNGPMFNIYHVIPQFEQEAITEVCFPIKLKQ